MYIERHLKMLLNNRKQISKNFVWTFQSTTEQDDLNIAEMLHELDLEESKKEHIGTV